MIGKQVVIKITSADFQVDGVSKDVLEVFGGKGYETTITAVDDPTIQILCDPLVKLKEIDSIGSVIGTFQIQN